MNKLTRVIAIQQQNPIMIGLPPFLTKVIMFVFKPIAHMAITIKNLLNCFRKSNVLIAILRVAPVQKLVITVVTREAIIKYKMNIGNIFLIEIAFSTSVCCCFFSFLIRRKDKTKVIGIIAKVLVSLTIVAYSKTAPPVPCKVSQVAAAAVTDDVSLMAVPANNPNPLLDNPSREPRVGKMIAAIILNKKITDIDCAISPSSASMIGAVAAIADPPHMEEPTPIKVAVFVGIFNALCMIYATTSEVVIVDSIIGSDTKPTFSTVVRFNPNPSNITAYCSIFFEVKLIPSA